MPDGDFSDRLALVRSRMGWNYTEAGEAVQVDGEAWARWELEGSRPQDFEGTCKRIKDAAGCNLVWLMTGQANSATPPPRRVKRRTRRNSDAVHRRGLEPRTRCLGDISMVNGTRRRKKPDIIPEYEHYIAYARPTAA